jgi:hypothetical protein
MPWAVFSRGGFQLSVEFDSKEEAEQAYREARPSILVALDQAGAHMAPVTTEPQGGDDA